MRDKQTGHEVIDADITHPLLERVSTTLGLLSVRSLEPDPVTTEGNTQNMKQYDQQ